MELENTEVKHLSATAAAPFEFMKGVDKTNNLTNGVFQKNETLTQHYSPVQWFFNLITIFAGAGLLSFLVVFYASITNGTLTFQGNFLQTFSDYIDTGVYIYSFVYCLIFILFFLIMTLWGRIISRCVFILRIPIAILFVGICTYYGINTLSPGPYSLNVQNADPNIGVFLGQAIESTDENMNKDVFGEDENSNPFGQSDALYEEFEPPIQGLFGLFRPFQLGFKHMPLKNALGFYFSARLACLMLVSFQLGLLLAEGDKRLSLLFMVMVSLAPATQWWFYAGNFVELLIFGQGLVLCVHFFLATNRNLTRTLLAILSSYLMMASLLVLNLTWQAPFLYIFLGLILWQIFIYHRLTTFSLEWDSARLIISLILLVLLSAYFASRFHAVYSEAIAAGYPMFSVSNGGGGSKVFGNEVANFYTSIYKNANDVFDSNPFEIATFWSLFPIGIILAIVNLIRNKQKDSLTIILLGVGAFLLIYILFGLPGFIARFTLLSATYPVRALVALTFVNLLLLIRGVSLLRWSPPVWLSLLLGLSAFIFLRYYSGKSFNLLYTSQMMVVQGLVFYFLGSCAFEYRRSRAFRNLFYFGMLTVSILMGLFINPVRTGIDSVDRTRIYDQIQTAMKDDPDGVWVLGRTSPEILNVFAIDEAKSIPSANIYENIQFWLDVNPEGDDLNYNTFKTFNVYIQNTLPTYFKNTSSGCDLFISADDFKKLGVGFVITKDDLTILNDEYITFKKLDENKIGTIYKVVYSSKEKPENSNEKETEQKKVHPNLLRPEQGV